MSFVKKAVKKVIKTVKKIVKSKIFKIVAIAALVFFTAGIAAGGFAAFSGVTSVGGFFTAVGQTIATGAASIAGGLGFKGASASLAQYGGAAAEAAGLTAGTGLANAAGVTLAGAPGAAGSVTTTAAGEVVAATGAGVQGGAAALTGKAAGSGFLSSVKGIMGKKVLGDLTIGEMAAKGTMAAVTNALSKKDRAEEPNAFVAGGLARGGGSEAPDAIDYDFGPSTPAPGQQGVQPTTPPPGVPQEEPTVAAQLAQGGQAQPSPASRIQALIAERGPISQPGYGGVADGGGLVGGQQSDLAAALSPQMSVQRPQAQPTGRTFVDEASQLQYGPRGLV